MKRILIFLIALLSIACGDPEPSAPECRAVDDGAYEKDEGWGASDYCEAPTKLGCFPFFASTKKSCKSFQSMRTDKTPDASVGACKALIKSLNCNQYENEDGDSILFNIENEGQLKLRLFGTIDGNVVDSSIYLNPCQQGCLSGITLETLNDSQQKVCEIPRQGKPVCLFPKSAHNLTMKQADSNRVNLVLGGKQHLLTLQSK